jgi:uncharacterized membrane protein
MNTIFGLPAHPLLVHIPIVLIPLLALMGVAIAVRPAWRSGLSIPTFGTAIVTFFGLWFAADSGESLQDQVKRSAAVQNHAEMGNQLKTIGLLFCLAAAGTVLLENSERRDWRRLRLPGQRAMLMLAFTVTILLGGLATVWDVRTGHSGAKAVWSGNNLLQPNNNAGSVQPPPATTAAPNS